MKKIFSGMAIVVFSFCSIHASELMTSAKQLGIGRVAAQAYATVSTKEIDFNEYGSYDFVQTAYAGKATIKLFGGWHLYLKAGKFTPELEKIDSALNEKFENKDDFAGSMFGGGVKWVIFPDTLVTPAVTFDMSYTSWNSDINKYNFSAPAGFSFRTDSSIAAGEIQGAVMVSKKLLMADPYIGARVFNTDVTWKTTVSVTDPVTGTTYSNKEIDGNGNGVAPFVGIKFSPLPFVSIVAEGSFVAEMNISAGVSVGF